MSGTDCLKLGMFGTGRVHGELRKSYCYICGEATLTRTTGKVKCTAHKYANQWRAYWARQLQLYWEHTDDADYHSHRTGAVR